MGSGSGPRRSQLDGHLGVVPSRGPRLLSLTPVGDLLHIASYFAAPQAKSAVVTPIIKYRALVVFTNKIWLRVTWLVNCDDHQLPTSMFTLAYTNMGINGWFDSV